ncbi:hypothetical protein CLPUN_16290 [Clostridium puniceum]|uniref:Uncharacterized protein n=1 Tax=Clostridium puniceum TaxID=29367 RepID=A0A1S8TPT9_9CLOT|nr:hypothetical protein [Clostridium puniceum]OOM79405.1 hypothetical protein CLPUN_16290 [Clostridium puniceum]
MQIVIQKTETLDNKSLFLIWFGDRQIALKEEELEELNENIRLFELNDKGAAPKVPIQEQLKTRKVISKNNYTDEVSIYHSIKRKSNHQ